LCQRKLSCLGNTIIKCGTSTAALLAAHAITSAAPRTGSSGLMV
jgi:hypothetical protein